VPSVIDGLPVRAIAARAFSHAGVTNVVVPDSVTSIGAYAFDHCINLRTITLSTNLTSLGDYAFQSCSNLVSLSIPSGVTVIPEGLAANCTSLGSVTIGNKVTSIGYGAFLGCEQLVHLNIPATLTSIGETAFHCCSSLRVTVDPANPFYSNDRGGALLDKAQTRLFRANYQFGGSYTVPGTVVRIDASAFYGAKLSAVFVPAGVTSL
jgi:hypothetical protein